MWLYVGLFIILSLLLASPTAAQSLTYQVQAGDTLSSIAQHHGVSVSQLAAANGLTLQSWVYTGQRLVIPSHATTPVSNGVYVVQPGDTLITIALRHNINVSRLAAANGLAWNAWVYSGQRLTIPDTPSTPTQPAPPAIGGVHVVQAGENLFRIGLRYGTTAAAIRTTNGLTSDTIYVGQRLTIPGAGSNPPTRPPVSTPPPGHGAAGEKWISINLSQQTLTAYEGYTPVFTAIVSTGTSRTPTVVGTYNVYVKYVSTTMSGPGYHLQNVPYTMYFYRGYGIHGTYWHNNFGTPMSHGCVNMRTPEAEWLYNWAPVGTKVVTHY